MIFEGPHSYAADQRRRHPRAPINSRVIFRIGSTAGGGMAVNVSEGGICIRTPSMAQPGQPVWLLLEIEGEALEASAEVVHGDGQAGYGLRFVDVEPDVIDLIRRYVAAKAGTTVGDLPN